jgi:hypothetical protein
MVNEFDDDYESDVIEDTDDDDELDEEEDYEDSVARFDDEEDDIEDDDESEPLDDEDDELEDDLTSVTSPNGATGLSRAADQARRLEERVLDALREEPVLGSRAIEIAVVGDGVVELTGTVHAIEEVSRASALARNVSGVSMVLNRIEVRSGGTMDTASVPRDPVEAPGEDDRATPNA